MQPVSYTHLSLSKPQTMEISMPSNDKNITEEQQSKVKASQAITLLPVSYTHLDVYKRQVSLNDFGSGLVNYYNMIVFVYDGHTEYYIFIPCLLYTSIKSIIIAIRAVTHMVRHKKRIKRYISLHYQDVYKRQIKY